MYKDIKSYLMAKTPKDLKIFRFTDYEVGKTTWVWPFYKSLNESSVFIKYQM